MDNFCTVSFNIADLGINAQRKEEKNELLSEVFSKVTGILEEEDVQGVQLYPIQWPRRVQLALKGEDVKYRLLVEGLDLFGKHVTLIDDKEGPVIEVLVYDAPMDMHDEDITDHLTNFGKVLSIADQKLVVNGRETSWNTGTKIVHMCALNDGLPEYVYAEHHSQPATLRIITRSDGIPHNATNKKCFKCGSNLHVSGACDARGKLCFICKSPEHLSWACPQKKKRVSQVQNDASLIFLGGDSTFSNFNKKYEIEIEGTTYICNEQFIQSEKAAMFGDEETVQKIMNSTDPRDMKQYGRNVKNFRFSKWKKYRDSVVRRPNEVKYSTHEEARKELLETGTRKLGEATWDKHWGIGMPIHDDDALSSDSWDGENVMGEILMEIREKYAVDARVEQLISDARSSTSSSVDILGELDSPQECVAVVIGDSNCRNLPIEDDSTDFKVELHAGGGYDISDMTRTLEDIKSEKEKVKIILIHVGTCDMEVSRVNDIDAIAVEYKDSIKEVKSEYPECKILVSSIPLRAPRAHKPHVRLNREISELNIQLKKITEESSNTIFIDNDSTLSTYGEVVNELYSAKDQTGVHLNEKGKSILAANFREALNEVYCALKVKKVYGLSPAKP